MACWVEELPLARSLNSVSCDNSLTADVLDSCLVTMQQVKLRDKQSNARLLIGTGGVPAVGKTQLG